MKSVAPVHTICYYNIAKRQGDIMRYTITIDKQTAPNTFDSVLVCVTDDKKAFEECFHNLLKAFSSTKTLQKTLWSYEEGFWHLNLEIKL